MDQQRKTLVDFRLARKPSTGRLETTVYNFLASFIGVRIEESDWKVYDIKRTDDGKYLLKYAVSIQKETFLVINAEIEDEDSGTRFTDMRLNEMIMDSWIAEGGQPRALQYLGIWRITNELVVKHMMEHFGHLEKKDRLILKFKECTGFHGNVFLRCGLSLVRGLNRIGDGALELKQAYYIKSGKDEDDLLLYIVMQLGEEGKQADVIFELDPQAQANGKSDDDGNDEVVFRGRHVSKSNS